MVDTPSISNIYSLQKFFDRIYVINLDRRPDREVLMMQKMRDRGLTYERIRAYDGSNLLNCRKTMSKGAWGYLLTWKNILEKAIKENINSFISFDVSKPGACKKNKCLSSKFLLKAV